MNLEGAEGCGCGAVFIKLDDRELPGINDLTRATLQVKGIARTCPVTLTPWLVYFHPALILTSSSTSQTVHAPSAS